VPSIAAARTALGRMKPSLIVLDLDQPGDVGFTFVKDLGENRLEAPTALAP